MCALCAGRYLRNIVVNWFDRAQDTRTWPDVFDRFFFLWIAFDAWSSNASGETDGKKANAWLMTSSMEEESRRNLPQISRDLQSLSKKGDIPSHVGNMKPERLADRHDFGQVMKACR